MNLPVLSQLPAPYTTVILLVFLIVVFVAAFKLMQMVMETVLVTAFSGGFYLALVYLFGFTFSVNDMLFYAFLGSTLYMGYSLLASAYGIASKVIGIPYSFLKLLSVPFRKVYGEVKERYKLKKLRETGGASNSNGSEGNGSGSKTKEVVLDKVNEENDD